MTGIFSIERLSPRRGEGLQGLYMADKKSIGIAIRRFRDMRGITQAMLAERVKIKTASISRIESGLVQAKLKNIIAIATALQVEPWQLFTTQTLVPYSPREPQISFEVREPKAPYGKPEAYEAVKLLQDPCSLGPGREISEEPPVDYAPILKRFLPKGFGSPPDRIVAFPTVGRSMSPTINDSSVVWIDRQDLLAKEGEIYAFLLPDKTITIKRLIRVNEDHLIIDGDNRDTEARKMDELRGYPKILYLQEDISVIRGRVIWVLNKLV